MEAVSEMLDFSYCVLKWLITQKLLIWLIEAALNLTCDQK
jgi:hypothetical protein